MKKEDFLKKLSKLIGTYEKVTRSVSTRAGASLLNSVAQTSQQLSRERMLDLDDLAALPKGRAVVLSSGNRPAMVDTVPWMVGPHAAAVKASIAAHDPRRPPALTEAEASAQLSDRWREKVALPVQSDLPLARPGSYVEPAPCAYMIEGGPGTAGTALA